MLDLYIFSVVYSHMTKREKIIMKRKKWLKQLAIVAEYIIDELELLKRKPYYNDIIKRNIQVKMWDKCKTNQSFTGMITKDALETGQRVKEHWYGATPLALDIMNMENPTVDEIVNLIKTKLTWNYTTKEENQILRHNGQDYTKVSELVLFN